MPVASLELAIGSPSMVAVSAALSDLPPRRPASGQAALAPTNVSISKRPSGTPPGNACAAHVTLLIAPEGHPDACASSVELATFTITLTPAGDDFTIDPPSVSISPSALDLLLAGNVQICARADANFVGGLQISGLELTFDLVRPSESGNQRPAPPPTNIGIIVLSQAATGILSLPRESHSYAFNARVGDRMLVDVTTMGLSPFARILRPDGSLLCSAESSSSSRLSNVCVTDVAGTYNVVVGDLNGRTGEYGLFAQRASEVVGSALLVLGRAAAATLANFGARDTYVFNANPGNRMLLTMNSVGLSPSVRIFRPDGTSLCTAESFTSNNVSAECVTDASGTYSIVAGDTQGRTGDYGIFLQRTSEVVGSSLLVLGQADSRTLDPLGAHATYVFNANPGDRMLLTLNTLGLSPSARIFRPDGTPMCAFESFLSPSVAGLCTVDASGTYSIVAGDINGRMGDYGIFLQRMNNVVASMLIVLGQPVAATLSSFGARHTYTFNANPGDHMIVSMSGMNVDPSVRVYRPDGSLFCALDSFSAPSVIDLCAVDASGTFSMVVGDPNGRTGDYGLFIQRTGNPPNTTFLNAGDAVSATLGTFGARNSFAFNGSAGDRFTISLNSQNLIPFARVYRSDGTPVCAIDSPSSSGASQTCDIELTAPYTIVAGDLNGRTGTYTITLTRAGP
ncbi:MAG TPA: hypothetical protein VGM03_20920 [Phycisphaerae bacterium]